MSGGGGCGCSCVRGLPRLPPPLPCCALRLRLSMGDGAVRSATATPPLLHSQPRPAALPSSAIVTSACSAAPSTPLLCGSWPRTYRTHSALTPHLLPTAQPLEPAAALRSPSCRSPLLWFPLIIRRGRCPALPLSLPAFPSLSPLVLSCPHLSSAAAAQWMGENLRPPTRGRSAPTLSRSALTSSPLDTTALYPLAAAAPQCAHSPRHHRPTETRKRTPQRTQAVWRLRPHCRLLD